MLTYKEPLAHEDADFKVRREFEVEVSDFAQAQSIVERLGFTASMRYEKYRETFTYAGAEIVLDELPVGNFMEIEATREQIRGITAALASISPPGCVVATATSSKPFALPTICG